MAKEKKPAWDVSKITRCIWIKFYAEQVGFQPSGTAIASPVSDYPLQISALQSFLSSLSSLSGYSYHAILHDSDALPPSSDSEFWSPSIEKPHVHLLLFSSSRFRVSTVLNDLKKATGLYFRPDTDTQMFRIATRFPDMRKKEHFKAIVYHTHETDQAVDAGKHTYSRSLCVTNIPATDLGVIYDTYFSQLSRQKVVKVDKYDAVLHARNLGRSGLSFEDWWHNDVPLSYRVKTLKDQCLDAYQMGISELLQSPDSKNNVRCSIFIHGAPNLGKTFTSKLVCEQLGLKSYVVEAGGTGKMDDLDATFQAMIVSDTGIKDLHGMADNDFCKVYRRGSANPVWAGKYLIITYNGDLQSYIQKYTRLSDPVAIQALCSRFYECILTEQGLKCYNPQTRGDRSSLVAHNNLFREFATRFNTEFNKFQANKSAVSSPEDLFAQQCADLFDGNAYTAPAISVSSLPTSSKFYNPAQPSKLLSGRNY